MVIRAVSGGFRDGRKCYYKEEVFWLLVPGREGSEIVDLGMWEHVLDFRVMAIICGGVVFEPC